MDKPERLSFKDLLEILTLILKNQTYFFREVYSGMPAHEIDLVEIDKKNEELMRNVFYQYDQAKNNILDYGEFEQLLRDLGLNRQFWNYHNPELIFK